jgi:hypothetical protein
MLDHLPGLDAEVVILILYMKLLNRGLRNPMNQSRVKFLSIRHYEVENVITKSILFFFIFTLLVHVIMYTEIHVHSMDVRILSDEIGVNLLLLSVLEDLLDEPLEVFRQILVLLK